MTKIDNKNKIHETKIRQRVKINNVLSYLQSNGSQKLRINFEDKGSFARNTPENDSFVEFGLTNFDLTLDEASTGECSMKSSV